MGRQAAVGSVCVVVGGWAHEYILLLLLLLVVVVVCVCVCVCLCVPACMCTQACFVCVCVKRHKCVWCVHMCVYVPAHMYVCVLLFVRLFLFLRGLQVYKLYIRVHMLLHVYQGG